mgnify:CR=1 FL=1
MTTITETIRQHAKKTPRKTAFRFLDRNLDAATEVSYQDFVEQIDTRLQSLKQIPFGSPVALVTELSIDFLVTFFSCMEAGLIPTVCHSPRHYFWKSMRNRLQPILYSSGAVVIFTDTDTEELKKLTETKALSWEPLVCDIASSAMIPPIKTFPHIERLRDIHASKSIAFLQYTSGSLGSPKGAIITNQNLMHNLEQICHRTSQDSHSEMFTWLPHSHDMGLVGGIMVPLYAGGTCTILSQLNFLRNPLNWWRGMTNWKTTITAAPSFAYELCLRELRKENPTDINLSSLTTAFVGAERIRPSLLKELTQESARIGLHMEAIYPSYGLAECTLMCSGPRKRRATHHTAMFAEREFVSCGEPIDDLVINNANGILSIEGPSVFLGYWSQPLLELRDGPFSTGDLCELRDGEIYPIGRSDSAFSVNGVKHHAEDFEDSIRLISRDRSIDLQIDSKIKFAVTHVQTDQQLHVVALIESQGASKSDELVIAKKLQAKLSAEHLVPIEVYFVKKGSLEFTTSGKPRRSEIQKTAEASMHDRSNSYSN